MQYAGMVLPEMETEKGGYPRGLDLTISYGIESTWRKKKEQILSQNTCGSPCVSARTLCSLCRPREDTTGVPFSFSFSFSFNCPFLFLSIVLAKSVEPPSFHFWLCTVSHCTAGKKSHFPTCQLHLAQSPCLLQFAVKLHVVWCGKLLATAGLQDDGTGAPFT